MSIFTIVTAIGIIQSLFLGIVLLTGRRNNPKANMILGLLLCLIASSITPILFFHIEAPPVLDFLFKVVPDVRFLFGPLLLFYAHAMIRRDFRFRLKHMLHFLPYYLAGVASGYVRFQSYEIWVVLNVFLVFICHAHVILYSVVTIVSLRRHVASIKKSFSSMKNRSLSWLLYLAVFFMIIFAIMSVLQGFHVAGSPVPLIVIRHELTALLVTLFSFSLGFLGLRQPDIFSGTIMDDATKYGGSSLTQSECEQFYKRLKHFMDVKRPFLDSELTIDKLAEYSGIPAYHLSRVINEKSDMIFYDFINSYRVEEVKRLINDPANNRYTILGLALDAGFNSKSAFYAAFKKFMRMTPVEYKKMIERKLGPRDDAP